MLRAIYWEDLFSTFIYSEIKVCPSCDARLERASSLRPFVHFSASMASYPSLRSECSTAFAAPCSPPLVTATIIKPALVPLITPATPCPDSFPVHRRMPFTHLWLSSAVSDAGELSYTDVDDLNADLERVSSRSSPTSPSVAASGEAESILLGALSSYRNSETNIRPNRKSFELVMQAYMNLGRSRFETKGGSRSICAADKLAELNGLMVTLWEEEGRPKDLAPTIGTFNAVLSSCAACAGPQKASDNNARRRRRRLQQGEANDEEVDNYAVKAERCLEQMQDLTTDLYGDAHDEGDANGRASDSEIGFGIDVRPDAASYSLLAAAWARQQPMGPGGTSWAGYERHAFATTDLQIDILDEINKQSPRGNVAQKANGDCASKAEERLRILEAMWTESDSDDAEVSADDIDELPYLLAEAYDDTLAAWARSGVEGAPLKAEDVLRRWENLADDIDAWTADGDALVWGNDSDMRTADEEGLGEDLSPLSLFPTSEAYTTVILAHALSDTAIGPRKAQELLEKTMELYEEGKWGECRPDLVAWNAVISSWASKASTDSGAAEEAESVLNRLIGLRDSDEDGRYNYLLPDCVSFNAAISGWCQIIGSGGRKRANKRAQAESSGNQKEVQTQAIERVKYLLDGMELESITNPKASPNARTYSSLIYALTKSGLGVNAIEDAISFLYKMEEQYMRGHNECRPSLQLYSAIITAYGRSGDADAGHKALDMLYHLNKLSDRGGKWDTLRPDAVIYSSVLDAIGKSRMEGGADIALEFKSEVESIYEATCDELCRPSVRFYTAVIFVLSQCREDGNAQKAYEILAQMERQCKESGDESVLPNSFAYNYAINCAANTLGTLEKKTPAFKVALHAFQSLRKSPIDKPNSFTYAFMIKACNSLLPLGDVRYKVVTQAFKECCDAGMLSNEVLKWFKLGVPLEIGRELLQHPDKNYQRIQVRDLPTEWSCNANRRI